MVILLGASGYVGQALATVLGQRKLAFVPVSRQQVDYTRFDHLLSYLRSQRASLVINAAGFTGKPNVDACELAKEATLLGNSILPATIAHACQATGVPYAHISSGCIYVGA
jgi:dTDP-4-dehydrorhamnose reductase